MAVAAILTAGALTLQLPGVQTFIAGKAVKMLSERLDGEISFEKIHLRPFTTLVLKNTVIIDKSPTSHPYDSTMHPVDTFFKAEYIIARFTLDGLIAREGVHLDRAYISNAQMNLVLEDKVNLGDNDTLIDNLSRIFRIKMVEQPKRSEKDIFSIRQVEIRNMGFSMRSNKLKRLEYRGGINWDDLDIKDINLKARNLGFKAGIMSGVCEGLSFREKSGYSCSSMTGKARVGRGRTIIDDLHIVDRWSDVRMPLYMMSYSCTKDFSDFMSKVKIDAVIEDSSLDFKTLSYFASELEGNRLKMMLSGKASGYVENFFIHGIRLVTAEGGFGATVSGSMTGLPDIDRSRIDAKLKNLHFTADGLGRFISGWTPGKELDLSEYAKGTIFMADAKAKGTFDELDVEADINSFSGRLDAKVRLHNLISRTDPLGMSGQIETDDLDIGGIIGTDILRQTTLRTGLSASMGNGKMGMKIDSLIVDRLHLNGYDYSGIAAAGEVSRDAFDGRIICNDPNLNFLFQGTFALSDKTQNALYKFYANVGHADLHAMNIDKRGISRVKFQTSANFTRTRRGDILGKVDLGRITLENDAGKQEVGDISLTSHINDAVYRIRLNSGFADGSYTGSASIIDFVKDLGKVTLKRELPAMFADTVSTVCLNDYRLEFRCHDSMDILAYALPGLYIADSTSISAEISKGGILKASISSPRIAFKSQYMKDMSASFDNTGDRFSGEVSCKEIKVANLSLNENRFQILAEDNHLGLGYTYYNEGELMNSGEVFMHGDLGRDTEGKAELKVSVLPSSLYLNSREWNIQPSKLNIRGNDIDVETVEFTSGEQRVRLYGKASDVRKDTLTLQLDRFDISVANPLLGSDLGIRGAATGKIRLTSPLKEKGLLIDMLCDSTFIAGEPLGILTAGSIWDKDFETYNISIRNDLEGQSTIDISGKLTPKINFLEATAYLKNVSVGYARPFMKDIFSDMDGRLSGRIMIDGPLSGLSISSEGTRLDDGMLKVAFTGVPYKAQGTFHIDDGGVYFDEMTVTDRYTGKGSVTGSINWHHFKDMNFDTRINVTEMECIDITEKDSDVFYGNLSATGDVTIRGPFNAIVMDIDAVTAKRGQFHIPLSNTATAGTTNLLKFKEIQRPIHIDPYEAMMTRLKKKEEAESDFRVNLNVTASPEVEAFVEIDKASGNVLSGRGNGTIDLRVGKDAFDINGDYTLSSGSYRFVAMGLVSRDFQIQEGSTINFNGNIMDSNLDINAVYKTKASLSTLISDTTSVANRRPVECGIRITDKLSDPRLDFSIDIPDLDPTIKSRVESALSTEDKIQKQFLSLIISNNFLPDEQSGIVNNSSVLYSNVSEIMANQLNNIFQKLDIPLDLGLNYQPNERGNDIFDVAVSTQLFNNRVVVNGSVGNKQYSSGNTQNDVVGDLDIEIKLDRSGVFRLNIFSHSADQYTNYLDNSQRNGFGLTVQTEFNSIGSFLRNLFSSRSKRQQAKRAEEQAILDEGRVELKIQK